MAAQEPTATDPLQTRSHPTAGERSDTVPESLFRAIANYTYDWETWSGFDGRPLWVNPAVERISGYSPDECLSMADYPMPIIHDSDRERVHRSLQKAAEGEPGNDLEFRILHKDGSARWGAVSWQVILNDAGEAIGYRTSVRDITERKRMESALREARLEAEAAVQAKSRFLASASHDLRQPVQALSMFLSALEMAKSNDDRASILGKIWDSLGATEELLNGMLDISQLDAGVLLPSIKAFHVGDVIRRVALQHGVLAEEHGLALHVVQTQLAARSDPHLVERVLANFVGNAIKYTSSGRILIGCRRSATTVRLQVWDTGIGIADGDIKKVFEEFRQLDNPERDRSRGLGLGLAIVNRISKLLGHPIGVHSMPGQGSMFEIALPRANPADCHDAGDDGGDEDYNVENTSVLYIDDDLAQLDGMRALLGRWGCPNVCAASPEEAIQELDRSGIDPDVAITDYRLRGSLRGPQAVLEVARAIGHPIAAAVLTGDTDPARITEATASGMQVLFKPMRPDVLKRTIAALGSGASAAED